FFLVVFEIILNQALVSLLIIKQLITDKNVCSSFFSSSNSSNAVLPLIVIYFSSSAYGGKIKASSLFSTARSRALLVSNGITSLPSLLRKYKLSTLVSFFIFASCKIELILYFGGLTID